MYKNFFLILFFFCNLVSAAPLQWRTLTPGLEYADVTMLGALAGKGIHVFRFDLQHYQLQLAFTQNKNRVTTIANLVDLNHAVIGVNGGFFSPDLQPLGLRIIQGQIKNPLKTTSWWGIFYTQNGHAYITSAKNFKSNKNINFAVQSGPRLVINGKIPSLKPAVANRTALGITPDGKVVLLVTNQFPLSMDELAEIMSGSAEQGGLNCVNALNLDGGSSTQLFARINDFKLSVPSLALVTDAVLVVPR